MNSKTILINSDNRVSGTSSHFTYEIPNDGDYTDCCVLGCNVPVSYYLIQSPYNTFILRELGVDTIITLPIGNYNVNAFKMILTELLNVMSPNHWIYSIGFNNDFLLQATGLLTFKVSGNTGQPSFVFDPNGELHSQFGFDHGSTATFVLNTLVSANVVSFVPESVIRIQSDICNDGDLLTIFSDNSIPYGNVSFQCQTELYSSKLRSQAKDSIFNFNVVDKNGNNINLNGLPVLINLLLFKRDNGFQSDIQNYIKYKINI